MNNMNEKFIIFEYDKEGYHQGGVEISGSDFALELVFKTVVKKAREEKRKVIITDVDDMCVFHMEDGEIVFPKLGAKE